MLVNCVGGCRYSLESITSRPTSKCVVWEGVGTQWNLLHLGLLLSVLVNCAGGCMYVLSEIL